MGTGKKAAVMMTALIVATCLFLGNAVYGKVRPKSQEPEPLFKTDKYSVLIHYMHEIYEHYTVAGKLVKANDIENATIHLRALQYYVDLIPGTIPDKDREGKPVNKELYTANFNQLKTFTTAVLADIKAGNYKTGKPLPPPDVVTKTCDDCHKNQKIPAPW